MNPHRHIECIIPILNVRDLHKSIEFYTKTLEFKLDWGGEADSDICSVSRDGCCIMLSKKKAFIEPTWAWIGLQDDSLFEVYRSKGIKVFQEPKNYSWAYEMKFEDIDGNILWLGTDSRKNEPFEDRNNG